MKCKKDSQGLQLTLQLNCRVHKVLEKFKSISPALLENQGQLMNTFTFSDSPNTNHDKVHLKAQLSVNEKLIIWDIAAPPCKTFVSMHLGKKHSRSLQIFHLKIVSYIRP